MVRSTPKNRSVATDPTPVTTGIHATNAWNPTGRPLRPVPGCRLYYTYVEGLAGARTYVFLGTQQHLSFAGDLEGHVPEGQIRDTMIRAYGLYPHLVDLDPEPDLPRVLSEDTSP